MVWSERRREAREKPNGIERDGRRGALHRNTEINVLVKSKTHGPRIKVRRVCTSPNTLKGRQKAQPSSKDHEKCDPQRKTRMR